jgi:SAM-dependent methyltransferase
VERANGNADMAAQWDGDEGADWAREWRHHDRAIERHHERLLDAAAITTRNRVIDIGCGNGATTRAAARAASEGSALGVDLSARMLERARELASAERLPNITFEQADVQVHPLEGSAFDVAISRFGVMFFADPVAAFTNIRSGLAPGARFVAIAWRQLADNEWQRELRGALALGRTLPVPPPGAPGPLGLADPKRTREILYDAGFVDVSLDPVDVPFWAGTDPDDACAFLRTTGLARGLTNGLSESDRNRAFDALRAVMTEHAGPEGVLFGSGTWLISARNP